MADRDNLRPTPIEGSRRLAGPREGRAALFVDRDGTLNELVYYADTREWESPRGPDDLILIAGAADALAAIRRAGWPVFLVSNQPSYAKGKTTLEALHAVHERLVSELARAGAELDGVAYCFHHPAGIVPEYSGPCSCRKPSPYSLERLATEHGLDLAHSWMVGDQDIDVACARNAGCGAILVPNPASASKRGKNAADLELQRLAQVLPALEQVRGRVVPTL